MDKFILASIDSHWQKVALVVGRALANPHFAFPEVDDDASLVGERVQALVALGQLEAHGDTSNWRFSEVRRVAPKAGAV
ncbi:DUF3658 domain-containing protein [Xanthomonas campestris]|uniref:DUF3658 domain-containing protein n=1 Tax=Xanthomonas campestris TaxID=339 RepID=UPI0023675AF8|nr:DUF3658 domain-containing protein [Xanthomonas campestris]WDI93393.1 hypothetical protein JH280_19520 [Xanthomonas campestris]